MFRWREAIWKVFGVALHPVGVRLPGACFHLGEGAGGSPFKKKKIIDISLYTSVAFFFSVPAPCHLPNQNPECSRKILSNDPNPITHL